MPALNRFPGLLHWTIVLLAASVVQSRSRSRPTSSHTTTQIVQCEDASGNVIPCKRSWLSVVIALSIIGAGILVLTLWFGLPCCLRRMKEWKDRRSGASQKYECLEEPGGSTIDTPIEQHSSDAPYDPPAAKLPSFSTEYVAPEIDYEYKPLPGHTDAAEPTPMQFSVASLPTLPPPAWNALPPPYAPPAYAPRFSP